jgi:D-galactarolactone cycloisomerase
VLVRLRTSDGVEGWGELFARAGADDCRKASEMALGASALASHPLVERLKAASLNVAAGFEIALWDIRGKIAGMSMTDLLGGRFRDAQPAYASLQNVSEAADVAGAAVREAEAAMARGHTSLKMKIGWHSPATDVAWVKRVLEALPEAVPLAIDANRALDMAASRFVVDRLASTARIMWFEEPLSRAWPEAYRELRQGCPMAIAGGESMDMAMLRQVIATRSMDIVNPDLVGHGGIANLQQLFALCSATGVRLVPHVFDGQLVRVATLHLLAAQPDWSERQSPFRASPLECDISDNPLRDDLLQLRLAVDADGCVPVPTGPGLGVAMNEGLLRRYGEHLAA